MSANRYRIPICITIGVFALITCLSSAFALDTVILNNGKVIQGAIIKLDSISVLIAPWEDRSVLFPRGEVYAKAEVKAITFDGSTPLFESVKGEKVLSMRMGTWELSLAASFRSINPDEGENTTFLNIPLRAGYFIARNVSLEVELMISQQKDEDMGYLMTASGLIHPRFPVMNPAPWMRGFLLFGWGFGTNAPLGESVLSADDDDPLNIIQGGLGYKIGDGRVGLRVEYRATSLFGTREVYREGYDNEGNYYAYRKDESQTTVFHSVMFGFSVFLGP